MAKKFRCPRPVNRLVMHRARGLSGPMAQNIGGGRCMIAPGQFWAPGGPGGGGATPTLLAAAMDAATGEMLLQDTGTGTPTATHTSTIYMEDHEDVFRPFTANVPVWRGGRVVENLALNSSNPATQGFAVTANHSYILSGTGVLNWGVGGVAGVSFTAIGDTASQRKAWLVQPTANGTVTVTVNTAGENIQFEESTGRSDTTTPSEYVPTTAATATKVFGTENGNSVISNVVTEAKGADLAQVPRLWYQPAATNINEYAYDATVVEWILDNTTSALDQVGLTGVPNTASTVTDASVTVAGSARTNTGITRDTNPTTFRAIIGRGNLDAADVKYPALRFELTTGASKTLVLSLDVDTGDADVRLQDAAVDAYEVRVVPKGIEVLAQITNDGPSGGNAAEIKLHPAFRQTSYDGPSEAAAQGKIVLFLAEIYNNTTIEEVRGLGPIITNGATASTDALAPAYDGANIDDDNGAVYCEWQPSIADTEATGDIEILSTTTGASLLYYDATNSQFESTDGTNVISAGGAISADTVYKIGLVWDATEGKMRLSVDAVWGTEGTYDGVFTGSDLIVGRAASYASGIRNISGYTGTYAELQTQIEGLMA